VFCYNPTDFANTGQELGTGDWIRVLRQARALGAVQLGLSGGEPLAREDLEPIVAQAHTLGFYINLITSGIGMTEARIRALKAAGLDHIQLSFQDSTRELNRSEERRVGKSVDLGGRRIIKKKKKKNRM